MLYEILARDARPYLSNSTHFPRLKGQHILVVCRLVCLMLVFGGLSDTRMLKGM